VHTANTKWKKGNVANIISHSEGKLKNACLLNLFFRPKNPVLEPQPWGFFALAASTDPQNPGRGAQNDSAVAILIFTLIKSHSEGKPKKCLPFKPVFPPEESGARTAALRDSSRAQHRLIPPKSRTSFSE